MVPKWTAGFTSLLALADLPLRAGPDGLGSLTDRQPSGHEAVSEPAAPALDLTTSMSPEKRSQHPPGVTRAYAGTCGYTGFPILVNARWFSH